MNYTNKKAQSENANGPKQKHTNDNSQTKNSKPKSIIRCPKCRSINPIDSKYCSQCGKVFSVKKSD